MGKIQPFVNGATLKSPYLWGWTIKGLKNEDPKREVLSKKILRDFLRLMHANFIPYFNCHHLHTIQQGLLKSSDFTKIPTNICAKIKHHPKVIPHSTNYATKTSQVISGENWTPTTKYCITQ